MPAWHWFRRLWRPPEVIAELVDLPASTASQVVIVGRVEALDQLRDPIGGEDCVLIEYRAWPPSTTIGVDGATAHDSRAYQVTARQAVDFVLTDGAVRVLVLADEGEDVTALHERMLARYGVGLRAEADLVHAGQRLQVAGRVEHRAGPSTPHRELPYRAIVRAERIRLV